MDFGTWLKTTRADKGLSGVQLERRTGISRQYISNLERGSKTDKNGNVIRPSRDKVVALAKALGANVDEALTVAGYSSQTPTTPEQAQVIEVLTHSNLTDADYEKIRDFISFLDSQKK